MFANTQMMGAESGFPDIVLAPTKPAPSAGAGFPDICLPPAGASPAPSPMGGGIGSILSLFPSFQPRIDPSVMGGGIVPSIASLTACLPNLPSSFAPPSGSASRSFQQDHGLAPSGALDTHTADALTSRHGG
jgi:hypothetical protein